MSENDLIGEILRRIERGELSADDGLTQLNALERPTRDWQTEEPDRQKSAELESEIARWKRWWSIPFSIGIGITLLGAGLMYWGVVSAGLGWIFWLSWIPLLFGQLVIILSWNSQYARWVHVRIRQRSGTRPQRIAFSLPLPIRFGVWLLRHFGSYIPQLQDKQLDDILSTLDDSLSSDLPIFIHVNEDEEDVLVYVG